MPPWLIAALQGGMALSPWGGSQRGGAFFNFLSGLGAQQQFNRAEQERLAGNQVGRDLLEQGGAFEDRGPSIAGQAQNLSQQGIRLANQQFSPAAVEGRFNRYLGGVVPGYEQLARRARGLVSQESGQEFADIRDAGGRAEQAALSGLASRGLATSTVAPSVQGSIREQTGAELNRARDARVGRLLGVEQAFGAAVPAAQAQVGQVGLQAQDNALLNSLGALQNFGQIPIDARFNVMNAGLGFYGPNTLMYPQAPNYATIQPYGGRR